MFNFKIYERLFKERSLVNNHLRNGFKKRYKKKNFFNFLISNIYDDLPIVFLEDFKKIVDTTKDIKLRPQIVVSDTKVCCFKF